MTALVGVAEGGMGSNDGIGGGGKAVPVEVLRDLVHDMRGPLVAATGFLRLLEGADSLPARDRYAAALRESIEAMNQILDDAREIYGGMNRK